jgi:hypothetical protein
VVAGVIEKCASVSKLISASGENAVENGPVAGRVRAVTAHLQPARPGVEVPGGRGGGIGGRYAHVIRRPAAVAVLA